MNTGRQFQLETNTVTLNNVEWEDVSGAIEALGTSNGGFMILSGEGMPYEEVPSGEFAYLQAATNTEKKGLFKKREVRYIVETRQIDSGSACGYKHYRFETADKAEVIGVFKNWLSGQAPDISTWKDVTAEMWF